MKIKPILILLTLSLTLLYCKKEEEKLRALTCIKNVVHVSAYNAEDGKISLTVSGGKEPYSYQWSNGEATKNIENLSEGKYIVTISDSKENSLIDSAIISQPQPSIIMMTYEKTNVSINNGSDGSIDITVSGGVPPYSFLWTNGETTEDIENLPAGIYGIKVTDQVDQSIEDTFEITEPPVLVLEFDITDVTMYGGSDGSIDMTIDGGEEPYQILWSNEETTEDIENLQAGTYSVTVTDNNGATQSGEIDVNQPNPQPLEVDSEITDETTNGACDGKIEISITSGESPYIIEWSNSESSETITNLCAGEYSVLITDAALQTFEETFKIYGDISCTDIDGREYNTVRIGNQIWMSENLKVKKTNTGNNITKGVDVLGGSWDPRYYEETQSGNSTSEENPVLYNWSAANYACPTGWHVPTKYEWITLKSYLSVEGNGGLGYVPAPKLKSTESSSGFNALFSGYWDPGTFYHDENITYYWSSTEWTQDDRDMWIWELNETDDFITTVYDKRAAFSIRCLKNL
jgi:uncharacterized protein (TIGR02145 family)